MGKRTNKTRPELVPHPRYGSAPRPSGISVAEAEIRNGFWGLRHDEIYPETVLVADTSRQSYCIYPRRYYVDILRHCRQCGRDFLFFALEQKYWFETLQFYVDADCVYCPECRRQTQTLRRCLRRYSDLRRKADLTRKELMTLVDDAAFLLTRGVLRDINTLGRIKNRALREIAEYPGVQQLAELLAKTRAAEATTEG
jgi:hypothetical protein